MVNSYDNYTSLYETVFHEIDRHIDRSIEPLIDFPYEKVLIHTQLTLLSKLLRVRSKIRILEIGSGFGQVPPFFSHLGHNAIGGDPFPREYVQKIWKILSKKYGCVYLKFDGRYLPFKNESFDQLIFLGVLEYVGADKIDSKQMADLQLLGEVWRILKPNGILLIGDVPNKYAFFKFLFKKLRTLPKGYSDREICNLLRHSGFQMVRKWRSTLLPARVRRISPVLERITSRICNIYLLIDSLLSRTFLGVMSTNLHYIFAKTLKASTN